MIKKSTVPTPSLGDYSNNVVTSKWVKDVSTAAVYVSPDGDDSNSGMTAAESVKTIGKAIRIIKQAGQNDGIINISNGTYEENLTIQQLNLHINIVGNIILNGTLSIRDGSNAIITKTQSGDFSITINGSSSTNGPILDISYNSYLYSAILLNINNTSARERIVHLIQNSSAIFVENINISNSYQQTNANAIAVERESILNVHKNLTISSGIYNHAILSNINSVVQFHDGINITNNVNTNNGIYVRNCSSANLSGTAIIYARTPLCAYLNCCILLENMDNSSFVRTDGSTSSLMEVSSNSLVILTPKSGKTIAFDGGNITTAPIIHATNLSFIMLTVGTYNFSGSCNINFYCHSSSFMVISGTSTMSGSITGKRFQVDDLSRISVSGKGVNFIPGTTAGTPSSSPDATKFAIYS